jgi:hypothetical protein
MASGRKRTLSSKPKFSQKTIHVGGKITIPHSHINTGEGEIIATTRYTILVKYNKGTKGEQTATYGFEYLNYMYGEEAELNPNTGRPSDLDDPIPF